MPFHEGEAKMQQQLHVPQRDNPTSTMLTAQAAYMLQQAPLLAIGTLDSKDRPWTSLWGGNPGFSTILGGGIIGTRALVDGEHDPVVQALVGHVEKGETVQGGEKMIGGLTIDLMARKRVKIFGRMVAACVGEVDVEVEGESEQHAELPHKQDQIQLVTKIEQSLGNCPKYLNQYELRPALVDSKPVFRSSTLSAGAKDLILKSDMFFLTTSVVDDMDTNHRGGPSGFVRVLSDNEFVYPEYSGNRLYQSLGNLQINPKIGVTFPDYESGSVLYTTGSAEILVGLEAARVLPGSNLAVKITVDEARLVEGGLPFRGTRKIPSPYNPLVRTLAIEGNIKASIAGSRKTAQLIKKTVLAPSIARFTFSVPGDIQYRPGQWVAFDFSEHLDYGYSHMRDDDPRSLNDDFVRTFTVSSTPSDSGKDSEFEITIRNVGVVTDYIFRQNPRAGFEVPIVGTGGDFQIQRKADGTDMTYFIAGGVGITPLLGQLKKLNPTPDSFRLLWTIRLRDIDFVQQTLQMYPNLKTSTEIFFTGSAKAGEEEAKIAQLEADGVKVYKRRMQKEDTHTSTAGIYYLCTGKALRKEILAWLEGKPVVFENFDY